MTIEARWAPLEYSVDIPRHLITQLAELTAVMDEDGTDLQAMLAVLIDDLTAAVPSFLGLTMDLPMDGHNETGITLNFLPPDLADAVGTTLLVPMHALGLPDHHGAVVFYAARPGAFVDLAADTGFALRLDDQMSLDEHLPSAGHPVGPSGVFGLTAASTINQAIGVLLDRGHTPQEATGVLRNRAVEDGVALHHVAQQLLDTPAVLPWPNR